ncbi:class I SAM-dependent methyltransferase [Micromonospora chersina]|uniref:class I SAM-dependent methyltransferase n=1 Tax=Micromonospora chersina TaxID=47854 RepID=UPI003D8C2039
MEESNANGNPEAALFAAREVLALYRMRFDQPNPEVVRLPHDTSADLIRELALTVAKSVRQVVPFSRKKWSTDSLFHLVGRNLAESGKEVKRLYLLPHRNVTPQLVADQVRADAASGIQARSLPVGRIPQGISLGRAARNISIIDGGTLALETFTNEGLPYWKVSVRPEEVEEYRCYWDILWRLADEEVTNPSGLTLEEPLALTADLVAQVAREACSGGYVHERSCAWYHGAWQYLRLLDAVSTPTWHDSFYRRELLNAFRETPRARVLISGCADYSVLAYVLRAAEESSSNPRVTVNDLCPTPLLACRWYARRAGIDVQVKEADILSLPELHPGEFDVIVSDAFLTRFVDDGPKRVLMAWRDLLSESGRIITTVRSYGEDDWHEPRQVLFRQFVERCVERAETWRWFLYTDPSEIREMAAKYAENMHSHSLGGTPEIKAHFRGAGLQLKSAEEAEVAGEYTRTNYLRIVAERTEEKPTDVGEV